MSSLQKVPFPEMLDDYEILKPEEFLVIYGGREDEFTFF